MLFPVAHRIHFHRRFVAKECLLHFLRAENVNAAEEFFYRLTVSKHTAHTDSSQTPNRLRSSIYDDAYRREFSTIHRCKTFISESQPRETKPNDTINAIQHKHSVILVTIQVVHYAMRKCTSTCIAWKCGLPTTKESTYVRFDDFLTIRKIAMSLWWITNCT